MDNKRALHKPFVCRQNTIIPIEDLHNTNHPVNNTHVSGKRTGSRMVTVKEGVPMYAYAMGSRKDDPWNLGEVKEVFEWTPNYTVSGSTEIPKMTFSGDFTIEATLTATFAENLMSFSNKDTTDIYNYWGFYHYETGDEWHCRWSLDNGSLISMISPSLPALGKPTKMRLERKGTVITWFIDGVEVGTQSLAVAPLSITGFGSGQKGTGYFWHGSITDVRLIDKVNASNSREYNSIIYDHTRPATLDLADTISHKHGELKNFPAGEIWTLKE